MQTERVEVAPGVKLAVDQWAGAAPAAGSRAHRGAAETFGTDPADVLLVHGLASNARMWDGVAESLAARGHRVATVDLRGHGRSSKPESGYEIATVADDVATLIECLRLARPVVAGQSWGGNVVLELAARHPDQVAGIVCVDGGWIDLQTQFPDWEACRRALAPPRLLGRSAAEMERWIRSAHADWPESGIRGTLGNFEIRPDGTIAPWLTYERHLVVLRGLWEHRPAERYPALRVPVLLAPAESGDAGGDRAAQKRTAVAGAAAAIPQAEVGWFHGDHDIHAQHPTELADVIHDAATTGLFAGPAR